MREFDRNPRMAALATSTEHDHSSAGSHMSLSNEDRLVDLRVSDLRALLSDAVRELMERRHEPGGDAGELLTTKELAKRMKVSPDTARKWRRQGCPHIAVAEKKLRWRLCDVLRWREEVQRG